MKKLTKTMSERWHAKRRFKERFGIKINRFDLREIIKNIRNNKYKVFKNQSNRITIFRGEVKKINVLIVYDKKRKTIVTFLEDKYESNM